MLPHRFVDGRNERGKRIFAGKVIQKIRRFQGAPLRAYRGNLSVCISEAMPVPPLPPQENAADYIYIKYIYADIKKKRRNTRY